MGEILLAGGVLLVGISVYILISTLMGGDVSANVLQWGSGDAPSKSKSGLINLTRPLVHRLTLNLAAKVKNPEYRKKISAKIKTAGLEGELNVDEFIGLKILGGVFLPILLCLLNFSLEMDFNYFLLIGSGLPGSFYPDIYANSQKGARYRSVIIDLPFFIDLMALSTAAGLDFIGAIQRVVEKAQGSILAAEFGQVLQDIKFGSSRAEALKKMADRLDIPEVTSFVIVVIDSDATGASIQKVLKDQSEQMRAERFMRAEKAGAKASQLILVPLMLFILPAVFLMVFGPAILSFMGQGGGQ